MGGPSPRRDHNTRKAEQVSWLAAWLTLCAFPFRAGRNSGLCRFQRRSQLRGSNGLAPGVESPAGAHHFPSRVPRRGPLGLTYSLVGMVLLYATKQRAAYVVEADGEVKRFVEIRRPENSKGIPVGMPLLLKPKRDRMLTKRTTSSSPRPSSQEPGPEPPEPPPGPSSQREHPSSPGPEPPEPGRKTRQRKRPQQPEPEQTRSVSSFSIHLPSDRNSKGPNEKIVSSQAEIVPQLHQPSNFLPPCFQDVAALETQRKSSSSIYSRPR